MNQERIKHWLIYDPATGKFTWRIKPQRGIKVGTEAGGKKRDSGYIRIKLDGKFYYAHRLAWLYMMGEWPNPEVDHRNTIRADNRWDNLREATPTINKQNQRRARTDNLSTGLLGAYPNKGGFMARITVSRKPIHLGTYPTAQAAYDVYVAAKRRLHPGGTL